MLIQFQPPDRLLAPFVACYWIVRGQLPFRRQQVLPNGLIEVIFNLGSRYRVIGGEELDRVEEHRGGWVAGIQSGRLVFEPTRETDLIGIRFRPGGAYPFFGFPVAELRDRVVDLDLLMAGFVAEARERLYEASSPAEIFACLERMLRARLRDRLAQNPAVDQAIERIRRARGALSIGALSAELGLSHKHLVSEFTRRVGLGPKTLAIICRFQHLLRRAAAAGSEPSWTDLAHACGYYDQAHMNRDFRLLAGCTPSEYLRRRLDGGGFMVLD
jgi:AraC-like DNA-binding protein